MKKIMKLKIAINIFLGLIILDSAHADPQKISNGVFPFGLRLDLQVVDDLSKTPSSQVVKFIENRNVNILKFKNKNPNVERSVNEIFSSLKYASPEILKNAEMLETYDGRMISVVNPCCKLKKDLILINETVPTYTLVHEFLHSQIRHDGDLDLNNIENRFLSSYKRMTFYQKKLFGDHFNLLNPQWRTDVLSSIADVVQDIYPRFQMGQVQEVVIEKVLSKYIDSRSDFYLQKRSEEGLRYAEQNINNMISIYNNTDAFIHWLQNTIVSLHEGIKSGDIVLDSKTELNSNQVKKMKDELAKMLTDLELTKKQILLLKDFYQK